MEQENIEQKIYLEKIKNMMDNKYNFSDAFQYISNQFDVLKNNGNKTDALKFMKDAGSILFSESNITAPFFHSNEFNSKLNRIEAFKNFYLKLAKEAKGINEEISNYALEKSIISAETLDNNMEMHNYDYTTGLKTEMQFYENLAKEVFEINKKAVEKIKTEFEKIIDKYSPIITFPLMDKKRRKRTESYEAEESVKLKNIILDAGRKKLLPENTKYLTRDYLNSIDGAIVNYVIHKKNFNSSSIDPSDIFKYAFNNVLETYGSDKVDKVKALAKSYSRAKGRKSWPKKTGIAFAAFLLFIAGNWYASQNDKQIKKDTEAKTKSSIVNTLFNHSGYFRNKSYHGSFEDKAINGELADALKVAGIYIQDPYNNKNIEGFVIEALMHTPNIENSNNKKNTQFWLKQFDRLNKADSSDTIIK